MHHMLNHRHYHGMSEDEGSDNMETDTFDSESKLFSDVSQTQKKRARVACSACQKAHATCDDERPCKRCTRRGIENCQDACKRQSERYLRNLRLKTGAVIQNAIRSSSPVRQSSSMPLVDDAADFGASSSKRSKIVDSFGLADQPRFQQHSSGYNPAATNRDPFFPNLPVRSRQGSFEFSSYSVTSEDDSEDLRSSSSPDVSRNNSPDIARRIQHQHHTPMDVQPPCDSYRQASPRFVPTYMCNSNIHDDDHFRSVTLRDQEELRLQMILNNPQYTDLTPFYVDCPPLAGARQADVIMWTESYN